MIGRIFGRRQGTVTVKFIPKRKGSSACSTTSVLHATGGSGCPWITCGVYYICDKEEFCDIFLVASSDEKDKDSDMLY